MTIRDINIDAVRRRLLESQALVPDELAVPVNYVSLREHVFLRELDIEITALFELLKTPEKFAEAFKARYAARENSRDQSIPFADHRSSPANQLYWDIAILVFQPKTMQEMLAIVIPGVTHLLEVSFPDQIPTPVRDPQSLKIAVDNLVPILTSVSLDGLTAAPTVKELSHYVIADNLLFDVRTIQPFSLAAHSQFYKTLQQQHPSIAKKLYAHNYALTVLEANILTFQSKGKTPKIALEQLKNAFILSGTKMTGSEHASKRAAIGVAEFMNYFDNIPDNIKNKLLLLKGEITLKEIIENIVKGSCVETTANSIQSLLEKHSGNPLLNAIIPTTHLDHLLKRYRYSRQNANALPTTLDDLERLPLPIELLKKAINGMKIEHHEDLIDLTLNFTPDYYELLLTNRVIVKPDMLLEDIALVIENNILSAEQYQALLIVIVNIYVRSGIKLQEEMFFWMLGIDHPDMIHWAVKHYADHQKTLLKAFKLSDTHANTILHKAAKNPRSLRTLFELLPKEKRLVALIHANNLRHTVLRIATEHPHCFLVLLELLSESERLAAATLEGFRGEKALHCVARDHQLLQTALNLIPKAERLKAVKSINRSGVTMLHQTTSNALSFQLTLDLYPEEEQLAAVKVVSEAGDTVLHRAATNFELLKIILALYPDEAERLAAVKEVNNNCDTVLHLSAQNAKSFQMVLGLYPKEQHLNAVKALNIQNANALHCAADSPESLQTILELHPKEERMAAVQLADTHGNTVLHLAAFKKNLRSLQVLLPEIPAEHRLKVMTVVNAYHRTPLHFVTNSPDTLRLMFEAIPSNHRLEAAKTVGGGSTVLHDAAIENPLSLHLMLELIPTEQRLAAIMPFNSAAKPILCKIIEKPDLLKRILELIPAEQRLEAVKVSIWRGSSLLHLAAGNALSLEILYVSMYDHQAPKVVKAALLNYIGELQKLFNDKIQQPELVKNSNAFFQEAQVDTKYVTEVLSSITSDINLAGNEDLHSLLTLQNRLKKFVKNKSSEWFQSVQSFLRVNKLPVEGVVVTNYSDVISSQNRSM